MLETWNGFLRVRVFLRLSVKEHQGGGETCYLWNLKQLQALNEESKQEAPPIILASSSISKNFREYNKIKKEERSVPVSISIRMRLIYSGA